MSNVNKEVKATVYLNDGFEATIPLACIKCFGEGHRVGGISCEDCKAECSSTHALCQIEQEALDE